STCAAASSRGGVSHSISMGRPSSAESARARFSAPRREARNDGLLALLAIIAIRNGALGGAAVPVVRPLARDWQAPAVSATTTLARRAAMRAPLASGSLGLS